MMPIRDDDYRRTVQQFYGPPSAKGLQNATTVMPAEISPVANVHRTFGGAFVEMQVWVPDSAVQTDQNG